MNYEMGPAEQPPMRPRASWDEYFCSLAKVASSRSTCPRLAVGAILVKDKQVLATGFNGAVRGAPHCSDKGCIVENGHCVAAAHAEANAIVQAAKSGVSTSFATMYVTANPCINCFKLMYQAGIKRIVYIGEYKSVDYTILGINGNCMPEIKAMSDTDSED